MRRAIFSFTLSTIALFLILFAPTAAQAQLPNGVSVTCNDGSSFDNGVEIIVSQMRSGFTYSATAIGLNGFDPVLAVLDESGSGLCSDDNAVASRYSANLPSAGRVPASNLSAQVTFDQRSSAAFADVSLAVGGYGSSTGEFLLILEGMGITSADNAGDPFSIQVTPGMIASGVPITVYMLTRGQSSVDPMIVQVDGNMNTLRDAQGNDIYCDDAGDPSLCYAPSTSLANSSITIATGELPGWQYDAMLQVPLEGLQLSSDPASNYYNFLMTSYQQQTQGEYLLVFHVGIADAVGGGTKGSVGVVPTAQPVVQATPVPAQSGLPRGFSVTCDDGTSFDNGVEVVVRQMRAGFTYTATAVGLNGFDPVLAVLGESGSGLCSDDNSAASRYSAVLPTTGTVPPSRLSAQVTFEQTSGSAFQDVSLVVGGYGGSGGEFILILEGMGITAADNVGDPFSVQVTPGMVNYGVPLTVYMMTRGQASVDPMIVAVDSDLNPVQDANGNDIYCDDAGDATLCYGSSTALTNYSVTINSGTLPGWQYDAMLEVPIAGTQLFNDPSMNYLSFLMTSYQGQSQGQYLLVFHGGLN